MAEKRTRETICVEVVRLLSEERKRQGISMHTMADRSGLNQSSISLMESDSRPSNPTLDTLLRIAEVLGVELGEVILKATAAVRQKNVRPRQ